MGSPFLVSPTCFAVKALHAECQVIYSHWVAVYLVAEFQFV